MIPHFPAASHVMLFADGKAGSALQVWATTEPGAFLVLRRPDRGTPFTGRIYRCEPNAGPYDVLAVEATTLAAEAPDAQQPDKPKPQEKTA
jgi:hypothetical protein